MKVLVACEFSGVVRDAFVRKGYRGWAQALGDQAGSGQNRLPPSPERAALRSITFPGIAEAMASQWTYKQEVKND